MSDSIRDIILASIGKTYKLSDDYSEEIIQPSPSATVNCQECGDTGFIRMVVEGSIHPPESKRCKCRRKIDLADNMERGWKGLVFAQKFASSELTELSRKNLWITAPIDLFKGHFRRVAIDKGPAWKFRVLTDADLVQAWLANIAMRGVEILDSQFKDIDPLSTDFVTLDHAAKSMGFLCIILGIKSTANRETPNVLMEVLRIRYQMNMPTWIVDQPEKPLDHGHLCYSSEIDYFLRSWPHKRVKLNGGGVRPSKPKLPSASSVIYEGDNPYAPKSAEYDDIPGLDQISDPTPSSKIQTFDLNDKLANRVKPTRKKTYTSKK